MAYTSDKRHTAVSPSLLSLISSEDKQTRSVCRRWRHYSSCAGRKLTSTADANCSDKSHLTRDAVHTAAAAAGSAGLNRAAAGLGSNDGTPPPGPAERLHSGDNNHTALHTFQLLASRYPLIAPTQHTKPESDMPNAYEVIRNINFTIR